MYRKTKLCMLLSFLSFSLAEAQVIKDDFLEGLKVGDKLEKGAYTSVGQGASNPIRPHHWSMVYHEMPGGESPVISEALTYPQYRGADPQRLSIDLLRLHSGYRKSVYPLTDKSIYRKGTYYLSFLINVGSNIIAGDNVCVLSFDGSYTGNFQRVGVFVRVLVKNLTFQFGIGGKGVSQDPAAYASMVCDVGVTYLVVLKYNFSDGKIDLFVNPAIADNEPQAILSLNNTDLSQNGIRSVVLNQRTNFSARIGRLRLAQTWRDVLGLPATQPTKAVGNTENKKAVVVQEDDIFVAPKNNFLFGLGLGEEIEKGQYASKRQHADNPIMLNQWSRVYHPDPGGASPTTTHALSYKGYVDSGADHYAISLERLTTGARKSVYSLANQTRYNEGVYYLAFLVNVASNTIAGDNINVISFDGSYTGDFQRIGMFVKVKERRNTFLFGLGAAGVERDPAIYTAQVYDFGTTYLVIIQYDFSDGKASLFVNPVISEEKPAPVLSIVNTDLHQKGIRSIVVNQRTNFSARIGGLRLATTWANVLGLASDNSAQKSVLSQ